MNKPAGEDGAGRAARGRGGRGFSLVECAVSVVLVSVLMLASLNTLGGAAMRRRDAADRARAQLLSEGLMSEIMTRAYREPGGGGIFGPEADEVAGGRAAFDDVDDYHGYSENPPRTVTGKPMVGYGAWTRRVEVRWVSPGALLGSSGTETHLKVVTVVVEKDGVEKSRVVGLKANLD